MSLFSSVLNDDILGRPIPEGALPDPITQGPGVCKREVYIAIRSDGIKGDGTKESPFNGSNSIFLDEILGGLNDSGVGAFTRLIFGPGIFYTEGSARNGTDPGIWRRIWPGQQFVGAGIFSTTLRLELSSADDNAGYGMFGARLWLFPQPEFSDEVLIQDTELDNFIREKDCGNVQAFNNRDSSTNLVRVYNSSSTLHVGDLTTDAENVLFAL